MANSEQKNNVFETNFIERKYSKIGFKLISFCLCIIEKAEKHHKLVFFVTVKKKCCQY